MRIAESSGQGARLLFLVNVSWFFLSHRFELAKAARNAGYDVHVATEICSEEDARTIRAAGLTLHDVPFGRGVSRPWSDVSALLASRRIMRRLRPDIVHTVGLKPLVIGGVAGRLAHAPNFVMAITGLGHSFVGTTWFSRLRRGLVKKVLHIATEHPRSAVIFQNVEDLQAFVKEGIVPRDDARLIRGSGVDLDRFTYVPEQAGAPRVLLASRMLRTKGVPEFVAAARELKARWPEAQFLLAGDPDPGNPASLDARELADLNAEGVVRWLGHCNDLASLFREVHVVVLPTYYKEGVPKVLIEAAASGRPIVTTDTPGCNDIVRDGVNGLLVAPRDVVQLVRALERLLADASLRHRLGEQGRRLAEAEFSLDSVIASTLSIYGTLRTGQTSVGTA